MMGKIQKAQTVSSIVAGIFGVILVGFLGVPVSADDLITFIPDWVKGVEGYWYGQEISNKEYVTFVDYIIKNQIVPDNYYRILSNKYTEGIITYNNTAVSAEILFIALNEWEKLNPDLAFIESSYSPSLYITKMEYQPFGIQTSSDEILLGYVQDRVIYVSPLQNNVTTINMIMHGVGITLGLEQINDDESHLMYTPEATKTKSMFDDKGYVLPELLTRHKLNSILSPEKKNIVDDGVLTYKIDPIPEKIKQKEFIEEAVYDGFNLWTKENPKLVFEEITTGEPDIQISWLEYQGTHIGLGCIDCLRYGATIEVVLEQPDCNGKSVQYDKGMITNTISS